MPSPSARLRLACCTALLAGFGSVRAVDWVVASGDWDVGTNWSPAAPPLISEDAVIGSGRSATITATGSINANTAWVGVTAGAGTVTQNANTFNIGTRLSIGNDGRNGTYNLNGGSINGVGRELILGRGGGTFVGGTGTYNQTGGSATFAVTNFGFDSAAGNARHGVMNLSGGTYTNTGDFNMSQSAAAQSTVNVQGGTLLSTGGNTHVGNSGTGAMGTFNVTSGTYTKSGGEFRLANAASSAGVVSVSGGVFSAGRLDAANGAGAAATINVNGGAFTRSNGQYANGANSSVAVNHTAGTLAHTSWTDFVPNSGSVGTWTQSGGTATFGDNFHLGLRGAATMNISGGVFSKTGGSQFDIAEGRDGTTTTRGTLNLSGSGVMNISAGSFTIARTGGTGTLNVTGGTLNKTSTGVNNIGDAVNTHAYINLSDGVMNTNGDTRIGNAGHGNVNHTGGQWNAVGSWFTLADANTAARGTYTISGGTLTHTGGGGMHAAIRGDGTFNVSGTGTINGGALTIGRGDGGTSPTGRWNQTGGQGIFNSLQVGLNTATGIFNLEGGTFRVSTINNLVGGGSQFNWGAGVLAPRQPDAGSPTGPDLSSGTGYTEVRQSTTTFLTNANLTTGNGVNAPSRLDLGGIYLSAGNVLFDTLTVGAGRTLNLASTTDVLEWNDDTSYLLRPFGFFTEDYGSLPLVATTGGGTITGTFDTFLGLANDGRGFSQFTGVFSSASALPTNTWYLEQTASAITFHYKVAGTVPEPGTFGLAAIGAYLLRTVRRRRG
jgi:hypothetical protein